MSKILAVDNDPFILEFLKDLLSHEGHEVLTAEDGLSAVDVLDHEIPDIIFVDLIMPNIDGKRLCKIIRSMHKLKDAYLIVLSATLEEEGIDFKALGVNQCLAKGPLVDMARDVLSAVNERQVDHQISFPSREKVRPEPASLRSITGELFSIKKHFEIIFERMSEGILEISREGRIVYANPAALGILDLPEEKLLASHLVEIFPEEYRQTVTEIISELDGVPVDITENAPVNINQYLVTVKVLPLNDDGSSAVLILNDVTKQKEAEEALKRRNRELELLNLSSRAFNSSLDLDRVLCTVLEELLRLMDVIGSTIWLLEPESGQLVCRQAAGVCSDALNGWRLNPEQGLAGWVAHHCEPLNILDARTDERHYKGVDSSTGLEMRSILGVPLILKGNLVGVIQVVDVAPGRFDMVHQTLLEWLAASAAIAIENARLYERAQEEIGEREKAKADLDASLEMLKRTLSGTIQAIGLIVERKDPYTSGHQKKVAELAQAIAVKMGLSEDQIECIRVSSLIHDIGKMAIPAAILSKPGILDKEEFALIKKHPRVGYDILKAIEFPWPVAQIVHQHHEHVDGSGYPQGLSGDDILLEAKIVCVSDVVEAMASHRPYRAALGIPKALEEISGEKRQRYDAEVVRVCCEIFEKGGFTFS